MLVTQSFSLAGGTRSFAVWVEGEAGVRKARLTMVPSEVDSWDQEGCRKQQFSVDMCRVYENYLFRFKLKTTQSKFDPLHPPPQSGKPTGPQSKRRPEKLIPVYLDYVSNYK